MKQSAVEWYEIEINLLIEKLEAKEISKRDFIVMKHNLFYPAKEMEKQQIKSAYGSGIETMRKCFSVSSHIPKGAEDFYNETYNK